MVARAAASIATPVRRRCALTRQAAALHEERIGVVAAELLRRETVHRARAFGLLPELAEVAQTERPNAKRPSRSAIRDVPAI